MADIAWTAVEDIAPELGGSALETEAQTMILAVANALEEASFKDAANWTLARVYLAAHLGAASKNNGLAVGPISAMSEGGVSVSYATLSVTADLDTTAYGQRYRMIVRHNCTGPYVG